MAYQGVLRAAAHVRACARLQVRSALLAPPRAQTHLKYAVEVQIPRATPMLGLLEPVLERVVYEDVPANLAALRQRVEDLRLQRRIAELEAQGEP